MKVKRLLVPGLAFLVFEVYREWRVMKMLGFEPDRFKEFLRGDAS